MEGGGGGVNVLVSIIICNILLSCVLENGRRILLIRIGIPEKGTMPQLHRGIKIQCVGF